MGSRFFQFSRKGYNNTTIVIASYSCVVCPNPGSLLILLATQSPVTAAGKYNRR